MDGNEDDRRDEGDTQKRSRVDDFTPTGDPTQDSTFPTAVTEGDGMHMNDAATTTIPTDTVDTATISTTAAAALPAPVTTTDNSNSFSNNFSGFSHVPPMADATTLPQQEVPSLDPKDVNERFLEAFPVDTWYANVDALYKDVVKFADKNFFTVRKDGERGIKCSRASNSNYNAKQAGAKTLKKKSCAVACDCKVQIKFSKRDQDGGRVKIKEVVGLHNHALDVPNKAVSERMKGRDIQSILPKIAPEFAPHMDEAGKVNINVARKIIRSKVGIKISRNAAAMHTIIKAVAKYIKSDKYQPAPPLIDSDSMISQFEKYITCDVATEKCADILNDVVTNSSGDTSWKVLKLLQRLKAADTHEFDYRIHEDSMGHIDAFTWQTGVHRAAFQLHGSAIFLDARKNEKMNELGMKYMTLVAIDANNKFWPISHSLVFTEDHELYKFACNSTLEMTPGRSRESIVLGYGDMFFEPDLVREWFPNIKMMIDAYHLIYAKKGESILAKEFGGAWHALRSHFINALEANTEDEFTKHIDKALLAAGGSQTIRDKIVKWQGLGDRWGHYSRNTVFGHRNISTSSYAEQNHWSIVAFAPDDANRSVEKFVVEIMKRDAEVLIEERQELKYSWYTVRTEHLSKMSGARAADLSLPREKLDQKPYQHFVEEYNHHLQYSVKDEVRDGVAGCLIRHAHANATESEGRFIPDGLKCIDCATPCETSMAMTFCRHDIAKCKHRKEAIFDPQSIDKNHLFYTFVPRARVDGTWVNAVARRSDANTDVMGALGTEDFDFEANLKDDDDAEAASALAPAASHFAGTEATEAASASHFAGNVLTSPSKQYMPTSSNFDKGTNTIELRSRVSYNTILQHGKNLGELVTSQCLHTQHAINNHLQQVFNLVSIGDYNDNRHVGTCVESLANLLASVAKDRSSAVVDMPTSRYTATAGRNAQYRLGHDKSTTTGMKKIRACGFCKESDHNVTSCSKLLQWGEPIKVKSDEITALVEKLEDIAKGSNPDFGDVTSGMDSKVLESKRLLHSLPSGTKHLQVKGYLHKTEKKYLLCTCIDFKGDPLIRKEGSGSVNYTDVLINSTTVMASASKFGYVLLK